MSVILICVLQIPGVGKIGWIYFWRLKFKKLKRHYHQSLSLPNGFQKYIQNSRPKLGRKDKMWVLTWLVWPIAWDSCDIVWSSCDMSQRINPGYRTVLFAGDAVLWGYTRTGYSLLAPCCNESNHPSTCTSTELALPSVSSISLGTVGFSLV